MEHVNIQKQRRVVRIVVVQHSIVEITPVKQAMEKMERTVPQIVVMQKQVQIVVMWFLVPDV
jgi:hypothetical protein